MTLKYFNVKNGLTTGNIILNAGNSNISAGTFIGNINATGIANLGSIANVKITGGAANYVISTDGTGNLTWAAQSGGGGGSGAYNPVLDTFTGTGSQTEFTLSVTPATIYNTIVNIDGVSQLHDTYSLVGATITFDSAPSNGAAIEVLILATTDAGGTPGGSNTQVQFNNDGNFGGSSGLTFDSTTTTLTSNNIVVSTSANLGSVSNVIITGGTTGQYLQTDGAGNLSWSTVVSGSTSTISNGNSNVNIATANGNITMSVNGTSNIAVVSASSFLIDTAANITGNLVVGNISTSLIAGTLTTGAQPNITTVGTLGNLSVTGNTTTSNLTVSTRSVLGSITGVSITGGSNGYMLTTDGSGTLSWSAQPTSTSTTDAFIGNGVATSFTLSVTPASIDWTVVNYNGVIVLRSDYTLTGNVIEFANAPANLAKIEVTTVTLSAGGGGGSSTAATVGYALVFGG